MLCVFSSLPRTEASGSWLSLGGRPETDQYLKLKQSAPKLDLRQEACTEAQQEDARGMCAKYVEAARHPDVFADCVFDVCHGGDETFAQSAAALIAA